MKKHIPNVMTSPPPCQAPAPAPDTTKSAMSFASQAEDEGDSAEAREAPPTGRKKYGEVPSGN